MATKLFNITSKYSVTIAVPNTGRFHADQIKNTDAISLRYRNESQPYCAMKSLIIPFASVAPTDVKPILVDKKSPTWVTTIPIDINTDRTGLVPAILVGFSVMKFLPNFLICDVIISFSSVRFCTVGAK